VHKALDLADIVYVLNKGSITFVGEAHEIDAERLTETYLNVEV
jgi:ABC-type branched-subunit amino acid transport system ATPase component